MHQLELHILGRIDGPAAIPIKDLLRIRTYREAYIACWLHRRVKNMTRATLAELTGMRASHISDYFAADQLDRHGKEKREMPGKYIPAMERVCGNTFITQWLALQDWTKNTLVEMLATERKVG